MRRWNVAFLIAGLLGLVIMLLQLDSSDLVGSFADLGLGLGIAAVLHFGGVVLDALTMLLCTAQPVGPSFGLALRAYLAGHAVNMVTPLANVGEVTKYTWLAERLPREEVAAAIFLQNVLWTLAGLAYSAVLAALAPMLLPLGDGLTTGLRVIAAVCAALGVALVLVIRVGVPEWPFKLARRLKISERRVASARAFVARAADETRRWRGNGRRATLAALLAVTSRLAAAGEMCVLCAFVHGGIPIAVPLLLRAWTQVVSWIFAFVPMGLGTAEGGAYVLFRLMGLPPGIGVMLELARKVMRLGFVAVGVLFLGVKALRKPG